VVDGVVVVGVELVEAVDRVVVVLEVVVVEVAVVLLQAAAVRARAARATPISPRGKASRLGVVCLTRSYTTAPLLCGTEYQLI